MKAKTIFTLALISLPVLTQAIGEGETKGSEFKCKEGATVEKFNALTVKGKVANLDENHPFATVSLYDNNEKVVKTKTDQTGSFSLDLENNKYYVLEVAGKSQIPKRIAFNTCMQKKNAKKHEFMVTLDLVYKHEVKGIDKDELDFPYAVIQFNDEKQLFDYDKEYALQQLIKEQTLRYKANLINSLSENK